MENNNVVLMSSIERWRWVTGFEGLYQISTWGQVYKMPRVIYYADGRIRHNKGAIMKQCTTGYGYKSVSLTCDKGKHKHFLVHRLVAEAFLPNTDNLPFINHKDEVKTNNHVENLEWCTAYYNNNYGTARERGAEKRRGRKMPEETKRKLSLANKGKKNSEEAIRKTAEKLRGRPISDEAKIKLSAVNRGKKLSDETKRKMSEARKGHKAYTKTPVRAIDLNTGETVKEYCSISEAERLNGYGKGSISDCCNGKLTSAYGYKWEFKEATSSAPPSVPRRT